jgi:hypothetical protein
MRADFETRSLMVLQEEVARAAATVERVRLVVQAMAQRRGIVARAELVRDQALRLWGVIHPRQVAQEHVDLFAQVPFVERVGQDPGRLDLVLLGFMQGRGAGAGPLDPHNDAAGRADRLRLVGKAAIVHDHGHAGRDLGNGVLPGSNPQIVADQLATPFGPEGLHCPSRRFAAEQIAGHFLAVAVNLCGGAAERRHHGLERPGEADALEAAVIDQVHRCGALASPARPVNATMVRGAS